MKRISVFLLALVLGMVVTAHPVLPQALIEEVEPELRGAFVATLASRDEGTSWTQVEFPLCTINPTSITYASGQTVEYIKVVKQNHEDFHFNIMRLSDNDIWVVAYIAKTDTYMMQYFHNDNEVARWLAHRPEEL
jgi:propanediol dehydratase small subunit